MYTTNKSLVKLKPTISLLCFRDSTSRHTKEWVNALKPPGLPAAHESRKDSDAKALRDRRSHAVALMQSAHSHREGAALLQSPTVSSSEDDEMWDVQAEADRLRWGIPQKFLDRA